MSEEPPEHVQEIYNFLGKNRYNETILKLTLYFLNLKDPKIYKQIPELAHEFGIETVSTSILLSELEADDILESTIEPVERDGKMIGAIKYRLRQDLPEKFKDLLKEELQ